MILIGFIHGYFLLICASSIGCKILDFISYKRKEAQKLVAEENYYVLICPRAKQFETIHNKLTTVYFIPWENLIEWIQKLHEILKENIKEKSISWEILSNQIPETTYLILNPNFIFTDLCLRFCFSDFDRIYVWAFLTYLCFIYWL